MTFSTMTDTEIRTANENARALRKEAIATGCKITEKIANEMIVINTKELNRRFHAKEAMIQGIEEAYESIVLDELFA